MPACLGFNYHPGRDGCNCRWWFSRSSDLQAGIDALGIGFVCSDSCSSENGAYYRRNMGVIAGIGISHANGNPGDGRCFVVSSRASPPPVK